VYFQNTAQTVYGLAMDATTGFIGIGKSTASFNLDVLSSATAVKVETTSTSSANAGIFSQASGAGGARAVVGYATGAGNVALEAAQGASGTAVFVRMLADGVTGIDLADGVATGNTRRWITATLNDVTGSNNTLRALQFTRGQTASPANTFTGDFFYMNEANSNATGNLIKIVKNAVDQFLIKSTGVVSMPVTQIGNGGLSAGDLYKDTAANILANGDFVVGMKA
jgi:hypothetical protein